MSTGVYSSSSANSLREQLREERSSGREMLFMWINHGFQGLQIVLLLLTDQYLKHSLSISEAKSDQVNKRW